MGSTAQTFLPDGLSFHLVYRLPSTLTSLANCFFCPNTFPISRGTANWWKQSYTSLVATFTFSR